MTASTWAIVLRWVCRTPLGTPVDPEVYMISASSASRRGTTWRDGSQRASARSKLPSGPVVSSVTFFADEQRLQPGGITRCP